MVLTFLRHGSNVWLVLGLAALIAGFFAGAWPFLLLWVVIGALTFYVSEYLFHRFSFHAEPSRFAFVRKLQHRLHYDHHAEPERLDLLFLPIWFLLPNLAVTALIFALLLGWSIVASAMFGVLLSIFHYEWVHYVAHIPYRRAPASAAGSSNITCAITISARSSGSVSRTRRWISSGAPIRKPARCSEAARRASSTGDGLLSGYGIAVSRRRLPPARVAQRLDQQRKRRRGLTSARIAEAIAHLIARHT
jgi:4-hydroxysphinganine ceramide fatty acyl 2-hydroxylase